MRLFFYGVLIGRLASPNIREMLAGIGPGRPARASGRLYAVREGNGFYPAMLPGGGVVHGMLHEAGTVDLQALDEFEFCYPHAPDLSRFVRQPVTVRAAGRSGQQAQAYVFNRPVTGSLTRIGHGDFSRWLRETGQRPFQG